MVSAQAFGLAVLLLGAQPKAAPSRPGALMELLGHRSVDVAEVRSLLDAGANLAERDAEGRTPLLRFLESTHGDEVDVLNLLLDRGADALAADRHGRDAISVAERRSETLAAALAERLRQKLLLDSPERVEPLPAGQGRLTFHGGGTYVGPLSSGRAHGEGTCTVQGASSACRWFEGQRVLRGPLLLDGGRYDGEYTLVFNGAKLIRAPQGEGVMHRLNGDLLEGTWSRGEPTPQATYTWTHSHATYRGEFANQRPHGAGKCTAGGVSTPCTCESGWWLREGEQKLRDVEAFRRSGTWRGKVVAGRPEGFGLWTDRGAEFWGTFAGGVPEGEGVWLDRGEGFRGRWHEGRKHGPGICLQDGVEEPCGYENDERYAYVGELRNGVPHGKGRKVFGDTPGLFGQSFAHGYEGDWKDGLYDGKGRLVERGVSYEGEFKAGRKQGKGRTIAPPSTGARSFVHEGLYREDRPNGEGRITWGDGAQYEGPFADGEPHGSGRCAPSGTARAVAVQSGRAPPPMGKSEAVPCSFVHGQRVP